VRLPDLDRFVESDVYAQILSQDGDILDESMSMGSYGLPMDPSSVLPGISGQGSAKTVTIRGVAIRVNTVPLRLPGAGSTGPFHVLQVGRSFGRTEAVLSSLQRTLLIGDVVVVLLAMGVGWWMAGSALRPIARATKSVQLIGEAGSL